MSQTGVESPGAGASAAPHQRKRSFASRAAFTVVWAGIVTPAARIMDTFGYTERVFQRMVKRSTRRLSEENPFRGYVPGKQDVFVATYAKSGTNWMLQIAHQLICHGKGEFDHIHRVVPWPDTKIMLPFLNKMVIPLEEANDWKTYPEQKRVIKTHFSWEFLPYSPDAHYIIVIRDPKDVFVSSYFFFRGIIGAAMPSVKTWFKMFLSGATMDGGWGTHAAGYWAQRHRPNVLIASYKTMKRDPRAAVLGVADFLNIHVPEKVIDEVCEKSSFAYMKRNDHMFSGEMPWGGRASLVRKGQQGGSSELLSREQQQQMDAHFIAELKRLGSDLPYEEFADLAP